MEARLPEEQAAAGQMHQQEDSFNVRLKSPCVFVPLSQQEELLLSADQYQANAITGASETTTYSAARNLYPLASSYDNNFSQLYPSNTSELQQYLKCSETSSYQQFLDQVKGINTPVSTDSCSGVSSTSLFPLLPSIYPTRSIYDDPFGFFANAQQLQQGASCSPTTHSILDYQRMLNWEGNGTVPATQYTLPTSYISPSMQYASANSVTAPSSTIRMAPTVSWSQGIVDSSESVVRETCKSNKKALQQQQDLRVKKSKVVAETVTSENQQQQQVSSPETYYCPELLPKVEHVDKQDCQVDTEKNFMRNSHQQKRNPKREYLKPKFVTLDQSMFTIKTDSFSDDCPLIAASNPSISRHKCSGSSRRKSLFSPPKQQKAMKHPIGAHFMESDQQSLSKYHSHSHSTQFLCDNEQPTGSHDNSMMTTSEDYKGDDNPPGQQSSPSPIQ